MGAIGRYRKIAREIDFRTLYSYDFRKDDDIFQIFEEHIEGIRKEVPEESIKYGYKILDKYLDVSDDVDEILEEHLEKWRLKRLGYPERAFLRLGTTELLFLDIPDKGRVFIDILDLANCYIGTEESLRFINGVLSSIYKKHSKDKAEADKIISNIDIDKYIAENVNKETESTEDLEESNTDEKNTNKNNNQQESKEKIESSKKSD